MPTIRPGNFAIAAPADRMRHTYDAWNEQIVYHRMPVQFLFIGESITEFWDLQTYFGRAGDYVVNRGISGDITAHMVRRFAADVLQLKPKFVHIMGGTNNTWRLDAFEPWERTTPEDIFQGTISDFCRMIRLAKAIGIIPIIGSNLPTGRGIPCFTYEPLLSCRDNSVALRNELINQINQGLRLLAVKEQAVYVDYHSYMTGPDGRTLRSELASDGLHPNVLGYNIMAEVLRSTLQAVRIEI
ncbi:G-D-S-L family lipolytic protein [Paenibacillus sp. sptzw28]|nr:G-D-S-L family lipolytic protein [Paenibacillus sp. sptzw28]